MREKKRIRLTVQKSKKKGQIGIDKWVTRKKQDKIS